MVLNWIWRFVRKDGNVHDFEKFKKSNQTKYVEFSRALNTIAFSIGENNVSCVHFILRITIC